MSKKFNLPKIIGHRGAKGFSPENTLISFETAHNLGAQWVETDVKESADGVLLLMHDDDFDRTTNFHGKVAQMSWQQIQQLDAGTWFSKKFKGEKIPSLEDAVALFDRLHLGVNLEIKACPNKVESTSHLVAEFIKNKWPSTLPPPLVSSFNLQALKIAKLVAPQLILGALFENSLPLNWKEEAQALNAYSINIDNDFTTFKIVKEIKNAGYHVLVYTVNCQKRAQELFDWGVTSIFTDIPWQIYPS